MSFWQGKSILVTGASGFIGSHLVNELVLKGSKVVTLSRFVESFDKVNDVIKKNKISIIFHLAAQPLVEIGQDNPIKTFDVNIKGTWNILEAARENQVQRIIIASTAHVYGDNPKLPFKEEYFPQPSRPYETSKACADLLAQSFADSYNLPVEIPRFVNIYGPGDFNFSRLIPKVIKSILMGEKPEIWDIGSVRDFLYIDDAIDAYLILAQKKFAESKRDRVFNFGTGKPIKIYELIMKIINLAKKDTKLEMKNPPQDRSNEIKKQYVSIAKAKRELGWYPKVNIDKGLAKTIEWYQENSRMFL